MNTNKIVNMHNWRTLWLWQPTEPLARQTGSPKLYVPSYQNCAVPVAKTLH